MNVPQDLRQLLPCVCALWVREYIWDEGCCAESGLGGICFPCYRGLHSLPRSCSARDSTCPAGRDSIPFFTITAYWTILFTQVAFIVLKEAHMVSHSKSLLIRRVFYVSVSSFGIAFTLWNIDNVFCDHVSASISEFQEHG